MTVNSIIYLTGDAFNLYMSIHSSGTNFFSSLVSQEATLSILLTHFTKHPVSVDLF